MQLSIRIAGPAGFGVKSIGKLLQKALTKTGLYTFGYLGYPSLIRGGQNFYQINISNKPINASLAKVDIFVPLNADAFYTYKYELSNKATVIIDANIISAEQISNALTNKHTLISIPALETLKQNNINPIAQNIFMVGVILKILGLSTKATQTLIKNKFASKGEEVVKFNLKALSLGYEAYHKSLYSFKHGKINKKNVVLSGNEAIALGFIKADGTFYSAYPMTPATNILHFLGKHGPKYNIIVRQASTEIEAIGVASGASFAGARAMVGTSGGGLDLMGEFISMLGITEIPLVIVDAQRTGPGTGLPTWTEQSDLNMARAIGHGEFPRIVLAPGDPQEAFELTQTALNWADKWQIPVILLSDKYLSESFFTVSKKTFNKEIEIDRGQLTHKPDKDYLRYKFEKNGVSKFIFPGAHNITQVVNSDEHDEYGNSIESDPTRVLMQGKRIKKLENIRKAMPLPKVYGPKNAKRAIVAWGSMKWPAIYLAEKLNANATKHKYAVIHFTFMYPLNYSKLQKLFAKYKEIILMENNSTAQLKHDLELAGAKITKTLLKFDGEPFFINEDLN